MDSEEWLAQFEPIEVTVAFRATDEYRELPWSALPKVELSVWRFISLRDLLVAAASRFGLNWQERGLPWDPVKRPLNSLCEVDFYKPDHEVAVGRRQLYELIGLDEDGGLLWMDWARLDTITLDAVVRGAEEGLIDGDPTRLYLILAGGGSRGGADEWAAFVAALAVAAKVIKSSVSAGKGVGPTLSAYRTIRTRFDVIKWNRTMHAPPSRVFRFLEARPTWTDGQLNRYFRLDDDEVTAALMTLAGFERRATDYHTWQRSESASQMATAFRNAATIWPWTDGLSDEERYKRLLDEVWKSLQEDEESKPSPERLLELITSLEPDQDDEPFAG